MAGTCRQAGSRRSTQIAAAAGQPFHHRGEHPRLEPAGGDVVQKEQRLGSLDENVVDAVIDQIAADGRVVAGHARHHQLGADAVGRGHQHRLFEARQVGAKQTAKAAHLGQHTRTRAEHIAQVARVVCGERVANRSAMEVDHDVGVSSGEDVDPRRGGGPGDSALAHGDTIRVEATDTRQCLGEPGSDNR